MKLEDITTGASLSGIEPSQIVAVIATVRHGDGALQLIYRTPDGAVKERLLGRLDEPSISAATAERPFSFDGDGSAFQLTCEAKRIDLAFLFDPMMAVHTSNVDALPHQITAVYESMLPRQPLRFVLADDPGAGKTIMAGLYISELIMRADARRILVVAPGGLVEQWRDELFEKFGLEFPIYSPLLEQASPSGNPFENHQQLIVRLDQLSRNEDLQEKLCAAGWDLAVFDEAHKLAAHYFGTKLDKTGRFRFAEKLGAHVRHLLLMTATPHNGKDEDFQFFLSLLDSDRFYGKFRDGVHKVDASDLMRRMVKEELVRFDGTPLFPERKANTVNYTLSQIEAALYEAVTQYVQTEMGKADQLQGPRKGSVGFALTALQRRLASSPEAIYQSLKRRKGRLEIRLREEKLGVRRRQSLAETLADVPEDDDDLNAEEQEALEETLVDDATAAQTVADSGNPVGDSCRQQPYGGCRSRSLRTKRGPTKPAKRKRTIKRQRKSAIERTRSVIRAERRASVAVSCRGNSVSSGHAQRSHDTVAALVGSQAPDRGSPIGQRRGRSLPESHSDRQSIFEPVKDGDLRIARAP